jgi:2-polyprenyl-3-methyl-5-hydroxy-6-metoxy-1,4-benzoquinol methylase
MKHSGWNITGVEPSAGARTKAIHLVNQEIFSSIDQVPANTFDVITLWHVLEHLTDLNTAMHALRHLLKPGGMLFIAVPNHASYDAQKYGAHWAGYDVPRHLWHFTPASMTRLFTNNNLTLVQTIPMKLDAYYVSLLSENYINKEQPVRNLLRGFFTGLLSNLKARKQVNYSSLIFIATATQK